MKVLKFGGTSVGSAQRIRAVAHQVAHLPGRKIVVLSAMAGTTDQLVQISALLAAGQWSEARVSVAGLKCRYGQVIEELFDEDDRRAQARLELLPIFEALEAQTHNEAFTRNDEKRILSKGEMMSIKLMALTLQHYENVVATHLNALAFMRITHDHEPDPSYIATHLRPLLEANTGADTLFLCEGYICVNAFGEVDNLRRGGSDYTATLIGEAAQASEVQIWTDIDGLHNNDPRVVNVTSPVRRLHFGEAAELAHFGAKILHPACIEPARRANIPVRLLYTFDPQAAGTTISCETSKDILKAVSAKDGISILTLSRFPQISGGPSMPEFMAQVSELLAKHRVTTDLITTTGDSYLLAVEESPSIQFFIGEARELGSVTYQTDMTILAIVGSMGWERRGFEARILEAIDDIPIRMISYGSSNYSLIMVVASEDKRRAMIALSDHLFANLEVPSLEIG